MDETRPIIPSASRPASPADLFAPKGDDQVSNAASGDRSVHATALAASSFPGSYHWRQAQALSRIVRSVKARDEGSTFTNAQNLV